jgi:putative two-component system response regulator
VQALSADPELSFLLQVKMVSGDLDPLNRWLARARVLMVDDQPANLKFLRHVLETEGYGELITLSDPGEALERFEELDPDLVIADLWMGGLDGFEFIAAIEALQPAGSYLPVLVATGDHTPETRRRALSAGARDFLTKPLSPAEVRLRVRNLLETRYLHERMLEHNATLEHRIAERTHELEEARLEILYRLARAAEFRDDQSGQHTLRVGRVAGRIAQVMGMAANAHELIARAAPLHDIGKIGIPDSILLKQDRLEPHERDIIQSHTVIGAEILSGSRFELLQLAEEIALSHHERWDGKGYPNGLAGDAIPLSGRIVAVADVFDALTHQRPYKHAWTVRDALSEIESQSGTQFDPNVVEVLLRIAPETRVLEGDARMEHMPPRLSRLAVAREVADHSLLAVPIPAKQDAPSLLAVPVMPMHDPATINAVKRLQQERDDLAREVNELRQAVARHELQQVASVARWTQPN